MALGEDKTAPRSRMYCPQLFRKMKFFILHRINMEVLPMDSWRSPDSIHIKCHENRTIFNEVSFTLCKSIFHVTSLIIVRIMSVLLLLSSDQHKESI